MKKIFALVFTFILLFSLFPPTARAADATIDTNGTYDISTFDDGAVVTINGGLSVTLTNTTDIVDKNISIVCAGANTRLGIDSLSIRGGCALSFNGAGNILTLIGSSRLESGGGPDPGIRVEEGTELTITGLGSVEAQGSFEGAGIGGGDGKSAGAITITGNAHVDAKTYLLFNGHGAGIGGGDGGGGGTIIIGENAVVTAEGHDGGAGIGSGDGGSGGTVIIGGNATVSADGGDDAAGIGGEGYTVEIGGSAQVTAKGDGGGAGIGG